MQNIKEVVKTFQAPFTLWLSWNDSRLMYKDLKDDISKNIISNNEKKTIWKPIVVFENTNNKDETYTNLGELYARTYIQIKNSGSKIVLGSYYNQSAYIFLWKR